MIDIHPHAAFTEDTEPPRCPGLHDPNDYEPRESLLPPMKDQALTEMTVDELLASCERVRNDLDTAVDKSSALRADTEPVIDLSLRSHE